MKHKVKLVWKAFRYDINTDKLEVFNVIDDGLIEDIEKANKKKEINSFNDLREVIRKYFMWRYWSKAEYEVIVSSMWDDSHIYDTKIDVYWQLEMNLDRIVEYINREMEIL